MAVNKKRWGFSKKLSIPLSGLLIRGQDYNMQFNAVNKKKIPLKKATKKSKPVGGLCLPDALTTIRYSGAVTGSAGFR